MVRHGRSGGVDAGERHGGPKYLEGDGILNKRPVFARTRRVPGRKTGRGRPGSLGESPAPLTLHPGNLIFSRKGINTAPPPPII